MLVTRLFYGPVGPRLAKRSSRRLENCVVIVGPPERVHQRLLVTEYAPGLLQQRLVYIDTYSLLLDAKMAIATVLAVLRRSNAY
jgi:hypothetical protein